MKKLMIIIFLSIGILAVVVFFWNKFFGYNHTIKENFGVDFNLNLQKLKENEEWSPNGDGTKFQIFQYKTIDESLRALDKLPIREELPPNEIPEEFKKNKNGFYKYVPDKNDNRNFNILIIDTLKKKVCVYYQIM